MSDGKGQKFGAIVALCLSLAASAALGARWFQLHNEQAEAQSELTKLQNQAALSTLDSVALPPNRALSLCNDSAQDLTVSDVAAVYWDKQGKLANFSSAAEQWHTWRIRAKQPAKLDLTSGAAPWDGSVVFYAADIDGLGKGMLVSGTSDDLKNGCVHVGTRE